MALPETETLQLESPEPHIQIVRLNRPEVSNAFNTQMGRDLHTVWSALIAEPGDIRCVILTATGGRAFCAGGDLKGFKNNFQDVRTDEQGKFSFEGLQKGTYKIYVLSKDPLNEDIYYRVQQEVTINAAEEIVNTEPFLISY